LKYHRFYRIEGGRVPRAKRFGLQADSGYEDKNNSLFGSKHTRFFDLELYE
jgi:hypothetical protein